MKTPFLLSTACALLGHLGRPPKTSSQTREIEAVTSADRVCRRAAFGVFSSFGEVEKGHRGPLDPELAYGSVFKG